MHPMQELTLLKKAFADGKVPKSATYCFLDHCPTKDNCIHHLCGCCKSPTLDRGRAVFPSALHDDRCRYFAPLRIVRMAWGFSRLFDDVKTKDAKKLRAELYTLFGSKGQYYRYKLGQAKLLPELQEDVKRLFAEHGYEAAEFDHFTDELDLSKC